MPAVGHHRDICENYLSALGGERDLTTFRNMLVVGFSEKRNTKTKKAFSLKGCAMRLASLTTSVKLQVFPLIRPSIQAGEMTRLNCIRRRERSDYFPKYLGCGVFREEK